MIFVFVRAGLCKVFLASLYPEPVALVLDEETSFCDELTTVCAVNAREPAPVERGSVPRLGPSWARFLAGPPRVRIATQNLARTHESNPTLATHR